MACAFARSTDDTRKEGATALVGTDGSTGSSVGRASAAVTVAGTTGSPITDVPAVVVADSTPQTRTLAAVVTWVRTVAAIKLTAAATVPAVVKTEDAWFIALDVTEGQFIIVNLVPH